MDKIIGIGNALVDVLVPLKDDARLQQLNLPKGSMQLIDEARFTQISKSIDKAATSMATGGAAGNTILGLACLGALNTGFIGKIGKDEYGTFYRDNLHKNHIVDKLLAADLPTGVATTFILPDGERTFATYLGASTLKAEDLSLEMFKGYSWLFAEGYLVQDRTMLLRAVELAEEAGLQICLDMASYNIVEENLDFFTRLIKKHVDIVFANELEARALTGEEPEEALISIAKMCSIAVVKAGAQGAYIRKGTETFKVKALSVPQPVDTTGAGDYFAAGFLYGLTCGYPLEVCGKIGSILAGNVIRVVGTTLTPANWSEIKQHIHEVY